MITVTATLLDCVVGAGAPVECMSPGTGSGAPVVCESPAKTEPESTHASATASAKRFIICSPLSLSMQAILH